MESDKPTERYFATRFASPRDEVLGDMEASGWANASSGDVASPSGFFSRITNSEAELIEIHNAFEETIAEMSRYGFTPEQLLGNFLVVTSNEGFVAVTEYRRASDLEHDFEQLEADFDDWSEGL
jgi:hypothetical protein